MKLFKKETEDNTILEAYKANIKENENEERKGIKALIRYQDTLKERPYNNDNDKRINKIDEQEKILNTSRHQARPGYKLIDKYQIEADEIIIKIAKYDKEIRQLTKEEKKYYKRLIQAARNQTAIQKRKMEKQIKEAKKRTPSSKAKQAKRARSAQITQAAAGIAFLRYTGNRRRRRY